MSRVKVEFDRYYTYQQLTEALQEFAAAYPQFASLDTIGKSYEGRDVWVMTLTNQSTGAAEDKPAMYIDANIHAGEVTGSMAALHLINHLLGQYDKDARIKKLLDTRTFYILPRINPDGAELYLTTPARLRSSVRPYPDWRKDEDPAGLHTEDINGDGDILLMRLRDDARGAWKVDPEDERLMVERTPWDLEGPFYHVFSEGMLRDDNGELVQDVKLPFEPTPTKYGLDLNRNFPAGYSALTPGSGPFPLSEPETRNQVEFISRHRNIAGVLLYHTHGGVLFRPHSTMPDKDFPGNDAAMFEQVGMLGTEVTGYPVVCCYGEVWSGVLDDWCYEQLGLFAFTPELWDMIGRAAPEMKQRANRRMDSKERRQLELKLLQWNDRELAGNGFVRWHRFQHPQLGEVELGGWRVKEVTQNPPPHLLEAECHKINQFALRYALALPEVHIDEVHVEQVGNDVYSLNVVVSNHGYLPTNISHQAVKQRAVRADLIQVELSPGMVLHNCEARQSLGYLEGYVAGQRAWFYSFGPAAKSTRRARWTIKLTNPEQNTVTIRLVSQRGGTVTRQVELK